MKQLGFVVEPTTWEERLEQSARIHHAAIKQAVAEAREATNRSFGQTRRYLMDYINDMQRVHGCLPKR